jgi:hypothetical protein
MRSFVLPKPNQIAVYSEIFKMDEQPDGTLIVHGKATDDTIDSDAQICDPEWLKSAMPEWFKFGNIREQHSSIAAGVAVEHEVKGAEHFITAHVVDAGSVAKVKAGVLKGFSIGIRGARVAKDNKAAGGRIVDGTIVEISLVDRPANPACTLTVAKTIKGELMQVEELEEKRDVPDTEREHLADIGNAMPDGSYPIASKEDLQNAIQSFGRAKNPEKVKEHIINRARELNALNLLPESWGVKDGKAMSITAKEIIDIAKSIDGDVTKFDQSEFDNARRALASLIQVEAGEMADGSDETHSLHCLLAAVHALFAWYEGEEAEGEVEPMEEMPEMSEMEEMSEMAIEAEELKEDAPAESDDVEMCKECSKALEDCECLDCEDCGKSMSECKCAEGGYSAEMKALTISDMRDLIADVVKTLLPTETVGDEVTKSSDSERIKALESELEQVKSLAVPSGPKRMNTVGSKPVDEKLVKAANYRAKAALTDDLTLRKGYLDAARELENNK